MVKLRLTRIGRKAAPNYRIIAIKAKTKRDGQALDFLGFYNPLTQPSIVNLNEEKIKYWLGQGAQPTATVKSILIKSNILPAPSTKKVFNSKPGNKSVERAEKKAEKSKSE
jgi:small subunit ribosomal protein S16